MQAIGRPELADDPRLRHDDGRAEHAELLDAAIEAWTSSRPQADVLQALLQADVPSGPINSAADLFADPQVAARGLLEPVTLPDGSTLRVPRITPLLSRTPASSHFAGPELGAHNTEIYGERLGLSADELARLAADGVI
jgi:formyl-CoA transferase